MFKQPKGKKCLEMINKSDSWGCSLALQCTHSSGFLLVHYKLKRTAEEYSIAVIELLFENHCQAINACKILIFSNIHIPIWHYVALALPNTFVLDIKVYYPRKTEFVNYSV
jgi:hypothetical protein